MRTYTEVRHEGEWFTDGAVSEWLQEHAQSGVRTLTDEQEAAVRKLATPLPDGRFYAVTSASGYVFQRVLSVGLYDGWPYWRKRLAVYVKGPLGGETMEAYRLTHVFDTEPCRCPPEKHYMMCDGWRVVDGGTAE
jgi:hypothetical protein